MHAGLYQTEEVGQEGSQGTVLRGEPVSAASYGRAAVMNGGDDESVGQQRRKDGGGSTYFVVNCESQGPVRGNSGGSLTTVFESTAVAVVEANTLKYLAKPLISSNLREVTCWILGDLAFHRSTATAVLDMRLYDFLATLWREDLHNTHPSTPALPLIELLARIARWQEGAEGVVISGLLNDVLEGLHSFNHHIRISTCRLLLELVGHKSTVQAVVEIVPREDIVALSTDPDYLVREGAVATLKILDATLERIDSNYSRNY
ncbi:hypothetical protein C8J57DRAFT_1231581 [Mycena rebaudengoi]|nr:hypothetical protein C8J57DRAFT_1231581 [Mycena rebaudengoi]